MAEGAVMSGAAKNGISETAWFDEDNTVKADQDEEQCQSGSTGLLWCEETSKCINSFVEGCPVKGGHFQGPTRLDCAGNMRCSLSVGCSIDMGSYDIGGLYVSGLNSTFDIPTGCTANCTGCTEEDDFVGGGPDENGCFWDAGEEFCPELSICVQPWVEKCPVQGEPFNGPTKIQCNEGRCSVNEECSIQEENYTISGPYLTGLVGNYTLPEGCTVNCTGCNEDEGYVVGGGPDENGCYSDAGEVFCPELSTCVQPWVEGCPVLGKPLDGPMNIQCNEGRCSVNEACSIQVGTYTIGGPYLTGLVGNYTLPETCTAICTGCEEVNLGSRDRRLIRGGRGNLW
jgi:hypothetical protein